MAVVKISGLPAAGPLTGVEEVPVVQTAVTVKTTVQDIANLAGATSDSITPYGADHTLTNTDATVLATAALTFTLPVVGISSGKLFRLKNGTAASLVIVTSAVNIDNSTTFVLAGDQSIDAQWDGSQYWIL